MPITADPLDLIAADFPAAPPAEASTAQTPDNTVDPLDRLTSDLDAGTVQATPQTPDSQFPQADQNEVPGAGGFQTGISNLVRGAAHNLSDPLKFAGSLTHWDGLRDFGVGVDSLVNKLTPVDPAYSDSWLATHIPQGLGMAASLAIPGMGFSGAGAKLLKLAEIATEAGDASAAANYTLKASQLAKAAYATNFAVMGGSSGYSAYQRSIERGDSPLVATVKSLGYATLAGALDAKMQEHIVGRLTGMFGGKVAKDMVQQGVNDLATQGLSAQATKLGSPLGVAVGGAVKDLAKEFASGAALGGGLSAAEDVIVDGKVDPGAALKSGLIGGAVQGIMGAAPAVVQAKQHFDAVKQELVSSGAPRTAQVLEESQQLQAQKALAKAHEAIAGNAEPILEGDNAHHPLDEIHAKAAESPGAPLPDFETWKAAREAEGGVADLAHYHELKEYQDAHAVEPEPVKAVEPATEPVPEPVKVEEPVTEPTPTPFTSLEAHRLRRMTGSLPPPAETISKADSLPAKDPGSVALAKTEAAEPVLPPPVPEQSPEEIHKAIEEKDQQDKAAMQELMEKATPPEEAPKRQTLAELKEESLRTGRRFTGPELQARLGGKVPKGVNAEIDAERQSRYPAEAPAEGEKLAPDSWKDGTKLPRVAEKGPDGKTQLRDLFTNDPRTTAMQLDKGKDIYVPNDIVGQSSAFPKEQPHEGESYVQEQKAEPAPTEEPPKVNSEWAAEALAEATQTVEAHEAEKPDDKKLSEARKAQRIKDEQDRILAQRVARDTEAKAHEAAMAASLEEATQNVNSDHGSERLSDAQRAQRIRAEQELIVDRKANAERQKGLSEATTTYAQSTQRHASDPLLENTRVTDKNGMVRDLFTNDPRITQAQLEAGRDVYVPNEIADEDQVHPQIITKYDPTKGMYKVDHVAGAISDQAPNIHPNIITKYDPTVGKYKVDHVNDWHLGRIAKPGDLYAAYKESARRKANQGAQIFSRGNEATFHIEDPHLQSQLAELRTSVSPEPANPVAEKMVARLAKPGDENPVLSAMQAAHKIIQKLHERDLENLTHPLTAGAVDQIHNVAKDLFDYNLLSAKPETRAEEEGDKESSSLPKGSPELIYKDVRRSMQKKLLARDHLNQVSLDAPAGDKATLGDFISDTQAGHDQAKVAPELAEAQKRKDAALLKQRAQVEAAKELSPTELQTLLQRKSSPEGQALTKRVRQRAEEIHGELLNQQAQGEHVQNVRRKMGLTEEQARGLSPQEVNDLLDEYENSGGLVARTAANPDAPIDLEANQDAAHKLGLYSESKNKLGDALRSITQDTKTPQPFRLLAKFLLESKLDTENVHVSTSERVDAPYAGLYKNGAPGEPASIKLNLAAAHEGGLVQTLLHEAIHHATLAKTVEGYKLTPVEHEALESLKALKSAFEAHLYAQEQMKGFKGTKIAFLKEIGNQRDLYGTRDIREFLSEVLTNPKLQSELASVPAQAGVKTTGKFVSILTAVKNWIKQLVSGRKVAPQSLLDQAFEKAMNFAEHPARPATSPLEAPSTIQKPKFYAGKSFGEAMEQTRAEVPPHPLIDDAHEAYRNIVQQIKDATTTPGRAMVNGPNGFSVNLASPDLATANRLNQRDGLAARVVHALTDSNRETPNANKVKTAPLISNTIKHADYVTQGEHKLDDGAEMKVNYFLKKYEDGAGERWHVVVAEQTGNFVTQFSFADHPSDKVDVSRIRGIGPRAPGASRGLNLPEQATGESPTSTARRVNKLERDATPVTGDGGLGTQSAAKETLATVVNLYGVTDYRKENIQAVLMKGMTDGLVSESEMTAANDWLDHNEYTGSGTAQVAASAPAAPKPPEYFPAGDPRNKETTSLSRALQGSSPELQKILKGKLYVSETHAEVAQSANDFIASHASLEDAVLALDRRHPNFNETGLTDSGATLARAMIADKFDQMATELRKNPDTIDKRVLAEQYLANAVQQKARVSEELTKAGQILNSGKLIADTFFPAEAVDHVEGPAIKTQAAQLKGNDTVTAMRDQIDAARATAAAETTSSDPVKKLVNAAVNKGKVAIDPSLQGVFDFFDSVKDSIHGDGGGMPATAHIVDAVAKRIAKLTATRTENTPRPVLDILESEVHKQVAEQIRPLLTTDPQATVRPGAVQKLLQGMDHAELAERAFNQARAKLLAGTGLTDYQRDAVEKARFRNKDLQAAQDVIRQSLKMRELVKDHLVNQNASLDTLSKLIRDSAQLTESQSTRVAEALKTAFDLEAQKAVKSNLDSLMQERAPAKRLSYSDRLLQMANLGVFNEKEFYNGVAKANPSLKLPVFDERVSAAIKAEADRIQGLPKGSDLRNEAVTGLLSKVAYERSRQLKGWDKAKYWLGDVAPAVWQAGVLSGPATQLLHAHSLLNLLAQSAFDALGKHATLTRQGRFAEGFGFYQDIAKGWLDAVGLTREGPSAAFTESKRALATGTSKFRNTHQQALNVLEQHGLFYKWVGRWTMAVDGINTTAANEIAQRQAMRFAQLQLGKSAPEVAQIMREAFDPDVSVRNQIEAQVQAETKAGILGSGKSLAQVQNQRRIELLEQHRYQLTPELQKIGQDNAENWTFHGKATGIGGLIFDGAFGHLNQQTKVSKFFLSFMNMAANLLNTSMDFSPLGILHAFNLTPGHTLIPESSRYHLEGIDRSTPEGQAQFHAMMAKGIVGTGAIFALGAMAMQGLEDEKNGKEPFFSITGSGPSNPSARQQWEQGGGWAANSMKIGSFRLVYTDLPIINLVLGGIGVLSDQARFDKHIDDKDALQRGALWSLGMVNSVFEKKMLSGLSNLFKVVQNPDERGIKALQQLTGGVVGGFTNPSLTRWARNSFSLTGPDGKINRLDQSTTQGWLESMLPMSIGYNTAALNVLGEPIQDSPFAPTIKRFLAPPTEIHPVLGPLVGAGLLIPAPSKLTKLTVNGDDVAVGRSGEVYRRFVEVRGAELKRRLTPDVLQRIAAMPDKEQAQDVLNKLTNHCRDTARAKLQSELRQGILSF